jgi:hypothetical protein
MHASSLIRTIDDVETPAPGRWTIAANQVVAGTRRDLGRRLAGAGRTIEGSLLIAHGRSGSSLDLTVAVEELPFPVATRLHYRATALLPTPEGIWLLNGDLTAGAVTRAQRALVRYQGVYRHGDRAAAWLTLHARIDLAEFTGRRVFTGRYLDISADLNADSPMSKAPALRLLSEASR